MLIANPIYDTVFKYMKRRVKRYDYEPQDELMRLILRQLEKAAGDNKLLEQLEMEEMAEIELENTFGVMKRQLQQKDKELEQNFKALEKNKKAIKVKDKVIEENKKTIKAKDQVIEENKKDIKAKDQVIEEKEKLIQELLSQLKNK